VGIWRNFGWKSGGTKHKFWLGVLINTYKVGVRHPNPKSGGPFLLPPKITAFGPTQMRYLVTMPMPWFGRGVRPSKWLTVRRTVRIPMMNSATLNAEMRTRSMQTLADV